jgi:threonine dehydrogenase-like Zn-dependent dehydrogenase
VASWYGAKTVALSLGGHFHRGRVRLKSSQVGRMNPDLGPRWDTTRRMETVLSLLPRLRLKELISHRFPFDRAPDAYRLVDERPEETVQVILTHDQS